MASSEVLFLRLTLEEADSVLELLEQVCDEASEGRDPATYDVAAPIFNHLADDIRQHREYDRS